MSGAREKKTVKAGGVRPSNRARTLGLRALVGRVARLLRRGVKDLVGPRDRLVQLQDGGHVAAAVAVVGRRPHCH